MTDQKQQPNAYREAPVRYVGCQHQLGCKCSTPFWLRDMSLAEKQIVSGIDSGREKEELK